MRLMRQRLRNGDSARRRALLVSMALPIRRLRGVLLFNLSRPPETATPATASSAASSLSCGLQGRVLGVDALGGSCQRARAR